MSLHEIKQVLEHNQRLLGGYTALLHERERDHAKIRDLKQEVKQLKDKLEELNDERRLACGCLPENLCSCPENGDSLFSDITTEGN